jgi:DNA-binding NarL/FixJ family response regulator
MTRTRVLIADDQALVRGGFRLILETQDDIEVVGEAVDGFEAVHRTQVLRPDVVLMDIRMPIVDGIEATRRIADSCPQTRVLVLTTYDLDEYVYQALRELVRGVRVVLAGEALLAPTVTRRLLDEYLDRPRPGQARDNRLEQLSERETDVLRLLARGRSNAEIAADLFLGDATVKTHVGRILTKLGVRDRLQAVVLAYESGLIRPGRSD